MRVVTILQIAVWSLAFASRAAALTGAAGDEAERLTGFGLTAAPGVVDLVSSLQWPVPQSPRGFSLAGQGLLGRYGLSAAEVLTELAPNLAACQPLLAGEAATGDTVHERYRIRFGAFPLAGSWLHLHHHKNKLVMLRAALPSYRLPPKPFKSSDFLTPETLGYAPGEGESQKAEAVIAESGGFPAPAWELTRYTARTGITQTLTIDAQTGALLASSAVAFDLAEVYEKGPADGKLIQVELPDLPGTGYLDGARFQVFAPTAGDPRVIAPDGQFVFRPDDPADQLSFDQVEAYYAATRVLAWFKQRFGDDGGGAHLTVHVNDLVGGRADNAQYVPPPEGPKIEIGAGTEALTNLARDTDVLSHEYAHHVIYEHLKDHSGESGVLHEGTADYFAYALNGDPRLGESLVPGGAYLRTAELAEGDVYDLVDERRGAHFRGQYWSAVLWQIRQKLGESADTLVYDALAYLGPKSGLKDAFLALLNADRDLNPLADGAAEAGVFGKNKCLILAAGIAKGFAQFLEDYDGLSCGLDLESLARASKERAGVGGEKGKGKAVEFSAFGRKCAVVEGAKGPRQLATAGWFWVPLAFVLWVSRRRSKHGS